MTVAVAHRQEVRPQIAEIFSELFDYEGPLSLATSTDDIERWDSLQHIALVRNIKRSFDISLSMDEMMEIRTIGDIETVLQRHRA